MNRWRIILGVLIAVIIVAGGSYWLSSRQDPSSSGLTAVRYGVTPFQDSALPVVAETQGWYARDDLDVSIVNLGWSDVPLAMASRSIDVAIYNFDSYMSASEQLRAGGADVIFYAPLYVWNGAAIMVRGNSGLRPAGDLTNMTPEQRTAAVRQAMLQLRGKRIGVTEGTTFEQTVRDALRVAGMTPQDVVLVSARPEDNLAAFIAGDLDAFSAGLTERVQAKRHGGVELIIGPDVSLPAIDGLIARREFAEAHPEEMQKLVNLWFETIRFVEADVPGRSSFVRDYLKDKASVDYSAEEYAIAWTFQHFPSSRAAARSDFLTPGGVYSWRPIWDANSSALREQGKISQPVPPELFWGERTLEGD